MVKFGLILKRFTVAIGNFISWANIILVFVILLQVFLRYGMGEGMIALEELQWHLYAVIIMIGFSYADANDAHVRVDLLSSKFSPKTNAWIEILGIVFLLIPFLIVVMDHGWEYTKVSFGSSETSPSPGGLPYRWIIKSLIPISMVLMMLSCFYKISRSIHFLMTGEHIDNSGEGSHGHS